MKRYLFDEEPASGMTEHPNGDWLKCADALSVVHSVCMNFGDVGGEIEERITEKFGLTPDIGGPPPEGTGRAPSIADYVTTDPSDQQEDEEVQAELAKRKSVWLIERGQKHGQEPPTWWLDDVGPYVRWTYNAADARQFQSKADAEAYALAQTELTGVEGIHERRWEVTEHIVLPARKEPTNE